MIAPKKAQALNAVRRPGAPTMLTKTPTQEAVVMWCARAAEEVGTAGEVCERIHSGAVYSSKQEAWAEAESMCEALGSAGLWFGAKRTLVLPALGGGHAR